MGKTSAGLRHKVGKELLLEKVRLEPKCMRGVMKAY